jgi:predicted flavoprotein YhiN
MKIKQLLERYNLKTRQSIYNWCEAMKITLEKDSQGHAYATPEQVEQLLDQLAEHLKQPGATLSSFTPMSMTTVDSTMDRKISPVHQQYRQPED